MGRLNRTPTGLAKLLGVAAACLTWGYGSIFFLYDPSVPIGFGTKAWFLSVGALGVLTYWILSRAFDRRPALATRWLPPALATVSLFLSLVVADTAYSIYRNTTVPLPEPDARFADGHVWTGELYPTLYWPTDANFRLQKAGTQATGTVFGSFYHSSMLASPTLRDSVLESQTISITINDRGFRESSPMDEATIFALGDSFAFGFGVDAEAAWPDLFEARTGEVVYNLGVHDASPRQEIELLDFVLRTYPDSHGIRRLLWMIYEGNDLEDDYGERAQTLEASDERSPWTGTVLRLVADLPLTLREQSIAWRLRTGRLRPRSGVLSDGTRDPYTIDGVRLSYPLYRSEALGWRLFYPPYVRGVAQDESYVQEHPNRERLAEVFEEMAGLARAFGFEVTVLLAPTAARLHGPYFQGFPELSPRPHVLDLARELAEQQAFQVIDLYEHLLPRSGSELLYFRDDDHFNEKGNELVAEVLEQAIVGR